MKGYLKNLVLTIVWATAKEKKAIIERALKFVGANHLCSKKDHLQQTTAIIMAHIQSKLAGFFKLTYHNFLDAVCEKPKVSVCWILQFDFYGKGAIW